MATHSTTAGSATLERIERDYEAVAAQLPDAALARPLREQAARELRRLGWPKVTDEQWRYANLRAFDTVPGFRPSLPASARTSAAAAPPDLPPALPGFTRMLYIDGLRQGGALGSEPGGLEHWPPEQRLGLLGDMFASDTATLKIRGDARIELLFFNSEAATASYPRLQLQLEPSSELQLVERHLGAAPQAALVCPTAMIRLAAQSRLTHYRLQQCGPQTVFTDTLSAHLAEGAHYRVRQIALGAASARTSAHIRLQGRGAATSWQSIAVGRHQQVQDTALKVEHLAPDTQTEEVFRGIAEERARIAFNGHIHIAASAPGSDSRQSLRGLIEGDGAEIDLRPRLQIDTDAVRAQHGATTGALDDNLMFYLLARGIDRATARALLKWAFLGDVLRAIELPDVRRAAEHGAAGQLPDAAVIGALT
ncbi:MAG TPA: SufD family Fe-S cluster assembly protein [Steroidobacteraceae bacterium]|jgi:Fe-S cluster assembly protein SufD